MCRIRRSNSLAGAAVCATLVAYTYDTHTPICIHTHYIYMMYSCVLILLVTTCVAYAGVIAGLGRQYALHSSHIHKVEFTEDDEHVLVASADGVVSQWRLLRHKAGVCEGERENKRGCTNVQLSVAMAPFPS